MKTNYKITLLITFIFLYSINVIIKAQPVGAGGWHSIVVCNDGTVKAFGENASGQLGDGTNTDKNIPVTAIGLSEIISVSGGGDQLEAHSMALKSDGTVWAWGSNIYGQLANGNTNNTNIPCQVLVLTDIVAISAGGWHSAALKKDGTVWTWGWNTDGQLGDGTTNDRMVPAKIAGLTDIIEIAAGTYHMIALKNDGTVWTWGDNVSGQIGDGTTNDRKTPFKIASLDNVVRISAGRFFSLAVKSDGTVWTWGENLYGQLGIGNTTDSKIPVQVPNFTVAIPAIVATGAFHCLVVKPDNTVWAWGRNTYGNLGDETVTHRSNPVQVKNISNVTALAAGTNFSLFVKNDGTFWGCGRNASGQLGDGTFLQRNTVVQSTYLCPVLQPIGINQPQTNTIIYANIFPNPSASGIFNIQFNTNYQKPINKTTLEIFNTIGVKIFESSVNYSVINEPLKIDISDYSNGVYFISLVSDDLNIIQKIIKQ